MADIEGKGKGVVATRRCQTGEVVCDYHKGQPMCIDAHSAICQCHPDMQTVGRFINHSKSRANLKPRSYAGEDKDVILFLATRDIEVNEEHLFHHGVGKKSFRGGGQDLSWLG